MPTPNQPAIPTIPCRTITCSDVITVQYLRPASIGDHMPMMPVMFIWDEYHPEFMSRLGLN